MFKMKKVIAIMLALGLLGSLSACGKKEDVEKESETIKLGAVLPETGDVAVYGLAVKHGYELAIKKYNDEGGVLGKQIELIAYDNKGDNSETVNAYNKLVSSDKIDALLGAVISTNSLAIAPLAAKDGIPMLTPTSTAWDVTLAGENVFRSCYTDPFQGGTMARFASEDLKAKTAAVMYDTANDYAVGLAEEFKKVFESNGGEIVNFEGFNAKDKDYKSVLTNIKGNSPEVLFIPDYYNTVALVGKQAKEVGIEATLLGGDGWDGVLGVDKTAVEGGYFANHFATDDEAELIQNFVKSYKEAYDGEVPNALAALGYDGAITMIEAIKAAGSTDADKIVEAINNTKLDLVCGYTEFDENRNPVKKVAIITIKDGEYKLHTKK
ncbi:ABC transporter substrate-binding protein [Clostridium sediminicola]|uniref:ABC transporter substrate-binding protein n=1 Tax=Clostridium sediminicola TaxID=3114879 RepID=UPI0031F1FB13